MASDGGQAPAAATPLVAAAREAIARHRLLGPGDRVLVAVSGGPDSVALLHVLTVLRADFSLSLSVCHVHHGLRAEADRDAEFVRHLAARLDYPATVERITVRPGGGRSPEEAARTARYAALDRAARLAGAARIALGHTADDQAETVLMRVLQGAGPRGLAGIPVRRGRLIRPLLEVDRSAVLAYLAAHDLPWMEDATNRDPKLLRNRIRHELLPLLAAHGWPRIGVALRRLALASREAVEALDALLAPRVSALLRPGPGGWSVGLATLEGLPPGAVKALLRLALLEVAPAGLRAHHLAALSALAAGRVGARVRLPGGLVVERAREALWVAPRAEVAAPVPLLVPGETVLAGARLRLRSDVVPAATGRPTDPRWEAWFDAERLPPDLVVRPRRLGDRIVPFGGDEAIRVSRLLADAAASRAAREAWPLLVARRGDGEEVLWVIGVRRGRAAPLAADTRRMLRVRGVLDPVGPKEELT